MNDELETTNQNGFHYVLQIIQQGQSKVLVKANEILIETYWAVGAYLSEKVKTAEWGKGVVNELAQWLKKKEPEIRGFSSSNLWRMKQFYEIYSSREKLATLSRVLSWLHHTVLIGRCKSIEEHLFYADTAEKNRWSVRELSGQIDSATYERTRSADLKLSPAMKKLPQNVEEIKVKILAYNYHDVSHIACKVILGKIGEFEELLITDC